MELSTRDKIIYALVRNNQGQRFTDLRKNAHTNKDSLARGLKNLEKEKIIEKKGGLYYFTTEINHPVLLSLKGAYSMAWQLDGFVEGMKKDVNPFPKCGKMIRSVLGMQMILKVERYTSKKLTQREKLEFDLFNDIFDALVEELFEIMLKKNEIKTLELKNKLINLK